MSRETDIVNRLGSPRLTITLLLLLAGTSILGTVLPQGKTVAEYEALVGGAGAWAVKVLSLGDAYHSWWFRFLLLLLAANMISCMVSRIPAMLSSLRGEAALRRSPVWQGAMDEDLEERLVGVLRSRRFSEKTREGRRILSKGRVGFVFTLAGHLSILIIMFFSALGSGLGFIGTQRVYVGDGTETYFNWKTMSDTRLPFTLMAEGLTSVPHPIALKIGIKDLASDRKVKLITTHVGDDFTVPGLPGRVVITGFDTEQKRFEGYWANPEGQRIGIGPNEEIAGSGLVLVPVAFAVFPEKQVLARTSLVRDDMVLASAEIAVNHPLHYQGLDIFLTDYGADPYGLPYVGYQIVKDPGKPGLWTGCVLFLLFITGALFVRHQCLVLVREGGALSIHLSARGVRAAAVEEVLEAVRVTLEGIGDGD